MRLSTKSCFFALLAFSARPADAVTLDVHDVVSIKNAASTVAYDLMKYYTGNETGGVVALLPKPYYWWEAGALWGAMIDYWHYTNDSSYNEVVSQALISQVGPSNDFMLTAQKFDEGNDDQAFWGFASMSAAEHNFPAPPAPTPSWLQITINLWNTQVARWDPTTCNGGLRWQIYSSNNGWNYKNTVSNGAFFQLSARLARFTGNATYVAWANKTWNWTVEAELMDSSYNIYDGANAMNCSSIDPIQWSYSTGIYMYGAAVMYNITNGTTQATWKERTDGLISHGEEFFFTPYSNATNVLYESACETISTCNNDEWSFKAYLGRFMWATTFLAPFTRDNVTELLQPSALAAAQSCTGDATSGSMAGTTCGSKWYVQGYDGRTGPGQQLSALEVMQGLMINHTAPPITSADVNPVPVVVSSSTTTLTVATSTSSAASTQKTPTDLATFVGAAVAIGWGIIKT